METDPVRPRQHLAFNALQANAPDEGVQWLREALAADPTDAMLHNSLAVALHDTAPEQAIAHWQEAARLSPEFFEPRYKLICDAARRHQSGADTDIDWPELARLCREAIALKPDDPFLLKCLSTTEWHLGHKGEAIDLIEKVIALDPADIWAYEQLGAMQRDTHRWWDLVQTARRVVRQPRWNETPIGRGAMRLVRVMQALGWVAGAFVLIRLARRK